jgi:hypothetical protein
VVFWAVCQPVCACRADQDYWERQHPPLTARLLALVERDEFDCDRQGQAFYWPRGEFFLDSNGAYVCPSCIEVLLGLAMINVPKPTSCLVSDTK